MKYVVDIPKDEAELFVKAIPIEEYETNVGKTVWEMVRKISGISENGMNDHDRSEYFGRCNLIDIFYLPYDEVRKLFDNWCEDKNNIHIGDEVRVDDIRGVVTYVGTNYYSILRDAGKLSHFREVTKTGRHFPEVSELLNKMKVRADDV